MVEKDSVLMERSLPEKGTLEVSVGEELRPFDHLGYCTASHRYLLLPEDFKPAVLKGKANAKKAFAYFGTVLGKAGDSKVTAPYNGYLAEVGKKEYRFEEEPHKHTLLSGVWGKVEKVIPEASVLIRTTTIDIQMVASTSNSFVGELVVFPNQKEFFEKYFVSAISARPGGKIIYIGDYIDLDMIKRAAEVGVGAVLAGSGKREVLTYSKQNNVQLGLISGFGEVATLDDIYTQLNKTIGRLVFFHGDKGLLRIPIPIEERRSKKNRKTAKVLKKVRTEMQVLTFQGAYFGYIGKVDMIKESSILVRFQGVNEPVEIFVPNFFILE
ncbi:hypothetical protein JXA34_03210 [Patescibacteria group bacterium]|nr:hypothetical protein [Patescibacteria group bacterium]